MPFFVAGNNRVTLSLCPWVSWLSSLSVSRGWSWDMTLGKSDIKDNKLAVYQGVILVTLYSE